MVLCLNNIIPDIQSQTAHSYVHFLIISDFLSMFTTSVDFLSENIFLISCPRVTIITQYINEDTQVLFKNNLSAV